MVRGAVVDDGPLRFLIAVRTTAAIAADRLVAAEGAVGDGERFRDRARFARMAAPQSFLPAAEPVPPLPPIASLPAKTAPVIVIGPVLEIPPPPASP